jgi:hypothetical protein
MWLGHQPGRFNDDLGDQIQTLMFLKNVSITGAFLLLVQTGQAR